jgi:hypothetical protein
VTQDNFLQRAAGVRSGKVMLRRISMVRCRGDSISGDEIEPNYGGRGVRIQVYWTKPVWSRPEVYWQSWEQIRVANRMLREETLSLDVQPALIEVPPIPPPPPKPPLSMSYPVVERRVTRQQPPAAPRPRLPSAFLDFDETIDLTSNVNREGRLKPLRSLIDRVPPLRENRLIVVFTPVTGESDDGTIGGMAITEYSNWLPWVLVGPAFSTGPTPAMPAWYDDVGSQKLIHEIGHACRLNHWHGVMQDGGGPGEFCNWQVHEINKSYWCAGQRPKNWWVRAWPLTGPYLWEE